MSIEGKGSIKQDIKGWDFNGFWTEARTKTCPSIGDDPPTAISDKAFADV